MTDTNTSLLRLPDVLQRIGLSRSYLYMLVAAGEIDPPVKLGPRASAWQEKSIEEFIHRRISLSDDAAEACRAQAVKAAGARKPGWNKGRGKSPRLESYCSHCRGSARVAPSALTKGRGPSKGTQ